MEPFGETKSTQKPRYYINDVFGTKICLGDPNALMGAANAWVGLTFCHSFSCQPLLTGHLLLISPSALFGEPLVALLLNVKVLERAPDQQ
jgi:hypothetical protein